jgi:hypothetical protein
MLVIAKMPLFDPYASLMFPKSRFGIIEYSTPRSNWPLFQLKQEVTMTVENRLFLGSFLYHLNYTKRSIMVSSEVRDMLDYSILLVVIGVIVVAAAAVLYFKDTGGHHHHR